MENKIVIALRRAYHCEHIRAVLAQNNLHYPVYELSAGAGSFDVLQKAVERGAKVLITGDTYVDAVMEKVNISVVTLRRGSLPFSDTIRKALSIADCTALVWRENDAPAAQRACGEFGGAAVFYPYQPRRDDLDRLYARLAADGFQAVVGAGILNEPAARYGITVFNVPYADSDILSAVRIAEHNLTSLEERQQYIETLNSIYDNISEGIVLVDPDGVIGTVNRAAAEYLQLNAQDLVGSHCDRTPLASAELDALLTGQEAFHNRLLTHRGQAIAMNGHPILVDGSFKACILTLTLVEQLRKTEQDIRVRMSRQISRASVTFEDIIGESTALRTAIRTARRYARVDSPVLICGESGTGKEMFTQSIHNASPRHGGPFVVINCGALPESLIESELFGYEKGSFTGALSNGKQGLFEQGHRGTVFLDEISEMPLHIQARFLRVLQEREVTPIGGSRVIPIDIRIIAATNRNLWAMVQKGQFREDLYFRLSVLTLDIPPLRDRGDDIELLVRSFVRSKAKRLSLDIRQVTPEAMERLRALPYAGNIRQLSNLVERAMVYCEGTSLDLDAVAAAAGQGVRPAARGLEEIDALRSDVIRRALAENHNNREATARALGISISTLYRRMRALNIQV